MPATPQTRFVVKRLNWVRNYQGILKRQPGEVAVASFATFNEANEDRNKREIELRKTLNPFACGTGVHSWSHLDEPRLRDWLMDHGIETPTPNKDRSIDWEAWWKTNSKKFSAEQKTIVWEVLDKLRFFTVREEPVRSVGFAVIEVNWEYNDESYDADAEGGNLVKVYRSRERAEAECATRNETARAQWGLGLDEIVEPFDDEDFDEDEALPMFDMRDRLLRKRGLTSQAKLKPHEGHFYSIAGVPFFEVIEVELEGLE